MTHIYSYNYVVADTDLPEEILINNTILFSAVSVSHCIYLMLMRDRKPSTTLIVYYNPGSMLCKWNNYIFGSQSDRR